MVVTPLLVTHTTLLEISCRGSIFITGRLSVSAYLILLSISLSFPSASLNWFLASSAAEMVEVTQN